MVDDKNPMKPRLIGEVVAVLLLLVVLLFVILYRYSCTLVDLIHVLAFWLNQLLEDDGIESYAYDYSTLTVSVESVFFHAGVNRSQIEYSPFRLISVVRSSV